MRLSRGVISVVLASLLFLALQGLADAAYTPAGVLVYAGPGEPLPNPLASTDILWWNTFTNQLLVADRSNATIDLIGDGGTKPFFAGSISTAPTTPNGVAASTDGYIFWGGTNGTLNMDTPAGKLLASASTNGAGRADELAVWTMGSGTGVVVIANDQATPPFLTAFLYSANGSPILTNLGTLPVKGAVGMEQTVFDPFALPGTFFTAMPNVDGMGHPAIIESQVNPTPCTSKVCPSGIKKVATFALNPTCTGATGLALDTNFQGSAGTEEFLVGCAPNPVIWTPANGIVHTTDAGNADEVWFNPGNNLFMTASNTTNEQNFVTVDPVTFAEPDTIFVGPEHNLAADPNTNNAFVLLRNTNPACGNIRGVDPGCIQLLAPTTPPPAFLGRPGAAPASKPTGR